MTYMWRNYVRELSGSFSLIREAWIKDGQMFLQEPSNGGVLVQKGWSNNRISYRQSPDFQVNIARIFILVGQSNMAGSSYVTALPDAIFDDVSNVLVDDTSPGTYPTFPTGFQSLEESATVRGVGPQITFAERLSKAYPDDKIVIIRCSQAGTGLDYWGIPGNLGHDTLMSRIDTVTGWLDTMKTSGGIEDYQFEAILSVQGENEADGVLSYAEEFDTHYEVMVSAIRTKVNEPNLPVILSKLSESITAPNCLQDGKIELVRSLQQQWVENDGYSAWFDTDGLYLMDEFHYGPWSQQEMGRRFAETYFANYITNKPYALITPISGQSVKTNASQVKYKVLFNRPVSGLQLSHFNLTTDTSGSLYALNTVTPSYEYEVSVSNMLYPGLMSITLDPRKVSSNLPSINRNTTIVYSHDAGVSNLLAYDGFTNVPDGTPMEGMKSGDGFGLYGWHQQNNLTGYQSSTASPLSYGSLDVSPYYTIGGQVYNAVNRFLDIEKTFNAYSPVRTGGDPGISLAGTVLWMSYLQRVVLTNQQQQFAAMRGIGEVYSSTDNMFQLRNVGGTWHYSIRANSEIDTGVAVNAGIYLMVWRIAFGGPSGTSSVHIWINPDNSILGGADPDLGTATGTASVVNDSTFVFNKVLWYPGDDTNHGHLDELRIGLTFASVTPKSS